MTLLFISPSETGWNYTYYESEKIVRVIEVRPNVNHWGTLCGYLRVVEVFPAVSVPLCKDESEYSASLFSVLFRSSHSAVSTRIRKRLCSYATLYTYSGW